MSAYAVMLHECLRDPNEFAVYADLARNAGDGHPVTP